MKEIAWTGWFVAFFAMAAWAQQETEVTNWKMQDSASVGATAGTDISSASYNASSWYTATVPGTVLNTLVDRGVYPDPNYGQNMLNIPDLANQQKRYWFQGTFPAVSVGAGQRVWLIFGGINYKAWIYLNGQYLDTMFGAFRQKKIDITGYVNSSGSNYIAVKIRGNFNPGSYHVQRNDSCGQNGGTLSQDGPTFFATQGWDWIPTIPDRCMGIWKPVYVRVTGPVQLRHPWNRTVNVSATSATDSLQVTLKNAIGSSVSGTVNADLDGTLQFSPQTVTVPADSLIVKFPALTITNPRLWWPNGYGDPNLYTLHISFTPNGAAVSDTLVLKVGVRQFTYATSPTFTISCNGQRILTRGGNWAMDDGMKRWNPHRLEHMIRYHKDMNFNMIRDWCGHTDCEPFYDLCDKYGIMVWSDFWEPHSADQPTPVGDQANYIANMGDKILRVRSHTSVAVWCARNETAATTAFINALTAYHTALDGTRTVINNSGNGPVHSGGPWTWTAIASCYSTVYGFHTEMGSPHVMNYESMAATFPTANLMPMANSMWAFHNYCKGNGNPTNYTTAMTGTWGAPATSDILNCTKKAQLMNYDEGRALEEALSAKRFNGATGLLLWMSSPVWPSLMWQTYDYFLEPTGGFSGYQKGSEPVHAMYYGTGTYQISVVNNSKNALSNYKLTGATYNLDGSRAWTNSNTAISVAADASANVFAITAGTSTPYFLDIKLRDSAGNLVSKNFYWLPANGSNISNMLDSTKLVMVSVAQTAAATWMRSGTENTISLNIVNPVSNPVPAVFCRLKLAMDSVNGTRILPVHINDNYFSLLPGDTQAVTMKFDEVDRGGRQPVLSLTGINVRPVTFAIGVTATRRSMEVNTRTSGFSVSFVGNKIRLSNVPAGNGWNVQLYNMQGRMVLDAAGGKGQAAVIPLHRLSPGAYVVTARAGTEAIRTMVTLSRQTTARE